MAAAPPTNVNTKKDSSFLQGAQFILLLITWLVAAIVCVSRYDKTSTAKKLSEGGRQVKSFYGGNATYFGGDSENEPFYGGASTANLVLLKKNGKSYDVLIGQLYQHGKRLQLPGGFVEDCEDMEKTALRGASAMTGEDYVEAYYGKGLAKTSLYKKDEGSERANVVIVIDKEKKLGKYDQNNELDEGFSNSKTRTRWVPVKDIETKKVLIRDSDNENVAIPFYLKRSIKECVENLCKK